MLELGKGLAFVGKQYHLEVDRDDFHIELPCDVAIELKNGPFRPEYTGKPNFYLIALVEDHPSIGLILRKDRNNGVAEYSPGEAGKPLGISRYELAGTLPKELKANLPTVEEVEAKFGRQGADNYNNTNAEDV